MVLLPSNPRKKKKIKFLFLATLRHFVKDFLVQKVFWSMFLRNTNSVILHVIWFAFSTFFVGKKLLRSFLFYGFPVVPTERFLLEKFVVKSFLLVFIHSHESMYVT